MDCGLRGHYPTECARNRAPLRLKTLKNRMRYMLWQKVWRDWHGRLARTNPMRRRRRRFSLPLVADVCEDRCLLSTITVTSLADNLNVDGQVTLREAIQAANTNLAVDGSMAGESTVQDTIAFQSGLVGTIALNPALGQ